VKIAVIRKQKEKILIRIGYSFFVVE
jgi:hypothetical protein